MKDYYTILGVEPDASPKLVKLAYRRLAREIHPDRMGHLSAAEQAGFSARMAEINEAYAVLSNPKQKREFDQQWRAHQAGEPLEAPPPSASVPTEAPVVKTGRFRTEATVQMASSALLQFAQQTRKELLANRKIFAWQEKPLEGFNWGLQARFWYSQYWTALRSFATADPSQALKFTNYAQLAVDQHRRLWGQNFFLFLMPFQRISDPERVSALCRGFSVGVDSTSLAGAHALIVLLDVGHGRSLLCGSRGKEPRFLELLQQLRLGRQ